ncbi:MAG: pyruvate kinase [Candidatus Lustribacter sp.]|jgi:pyruvate kinase
MDTMTDGDPRALLRQLLTIRAEISAEATTQLEAWQPNILRTEFLPSALNLAHYLALRRRDLREVQLALMPLGLSSLGRCESHVLPNLDAVIAALSRAAGEIEPRPYPTSAQFFAGQAALGAAAEELLGPPPGGRTVRIMATLPAEAAADPAYLHRLLLAGANVVRINCAHDDEATWRAMVANTRAAAKKLGRTCPVYVDIAGPKLRVDDVRASGHHIDRGPRVRVGDRVLLGDSDVELSKGFKIALCSSIPQLVSRVRVGARVSIDDGKAEARIVDVHHGALVIEFFQAPAKGLRMRAMRGLNFPDSELGLPAITDKDKNDLAFIAAEGDMVGYSFVNTPDDVAQLQAEIERHPRAAREPLAIVLKIETLSAVRNLPALIVAAASRDPVGVMIARGDLAVNIGYRRLAEIQEEILWLCESAHIPVIWATQVLERLVREGQSSRGEFTDAAMAERAECVMLNKGPYLAEATVALADVLGRMEGHQTKKTSRLRPLHAWDTSTVTSSAGLTTAR